MTQYHFLDESGDPGLSGAKGSSSHFVIGLVQLAERVSLPELATLRRDFHLPGFEFKYHKTTTAHKTAFFKAIRPIAFRVRAAVVDKSRLLNELVGLSGHHIAIELISRLALRASELDLANDTLILDGAPPAFRRALRIRISSDCRKQKRIRPFSKIISGDSLHEDGLQLADMITGAVRQYVLDIDREHYLSFASKVVDLWEIPPKQK